MNGIDLECAQLDSNSMAILKAVSSRIACDGNRSIVDVGCGHGRLLRVLNNLGMNSLAGVGWTVAGPSGAMLIERTDLAQAGWASQFKGQRFDWVVSTEVLEHLVNPYQFLKELRQLIKPEGHLLMTFPNVHNWRSIVGYALTGRFSGFFGPNFNANHPLHDQHIFIPNMHLVRYFFKITGFEIKKTSHINGFSRLFAQTTMLVAVPTEQVEII